MKENFNEEQQKINAAKLSRLNDFIGTKDEFNIIRIISSLENGVNYVLNDKLPIFKFAWDNNMLTLCNFICDNIKFNPNALCVIGESEKYPISHIIIKELLCYSKHFPKWKYDIFFPVLEKVLTHPKIDYSLMDEEGKTLLMYIASKKELNHIEWHFNNGNTTGNMSSVDKKDMSAVSYAINNGNYEILNDILNIKDYKLSETDKTIVSNAVKQIVNFINFHHEQFDYYINL